jgi:hypothetical protein
MSVKSLKLEDVVVALDDPEIQAAVAVLYPGAKNIFPLVEQQLTFELEGVTAAVSNALQRTMTQEIRGLAFHVQEEDIGVGPSAEYDPFMSPEFLQERIQNFPIRFGVRFSDVKDLTLRIEIQNPTHAVKSVYLGDFKTYMKGVPVELPLPLYNPTHKVADIQPGKCLKVHNVRVVESTGRIFTAASASVRGWQYPLDIPRRPKKETHFGSQGAAQSSGYMQSAFVATPRKFRVGSTIVAALKGSQTGKALPGDACSNILKRLRVVHGILERGVQAAEAKSGTPAFDAEAPDADNNYWFVRRGASDEPELGGGGGDLARLIGVLHLRGETRTITELIRDELNRLVPDIGSIGAAELPDSDAIQLTIRHRGDPEDLNRHVRQTLSNLLALFTSLQTQFGSM